MEKLTKILLAIALGAMTTLCGPMFAPVFLPVLITLPIYAIAYYLWDQRCPANRPVRYTIGLLVILTSTVWLPIVILVTWAAILLTAITITSALS